jgi:thiosulfate/3-mercaptopyruvate sulfurtransferase
MDLKAMRRRDFLHIATASLFLAAAASAQTEDPWTPEELVEPAQLAKELATNASDIHLLYVGFPILYRGAHITGAVLAGPCSKPEGLASLKKTALNLSPDREVVLYCGCCPLVRCPNIRPAYTAMREMKFTRLKVLHLPTNLHTDWISKGYPVQKSV